MTAASGGPGEKPDYQGPPSGYNTPADPAYGGWQPSAAPAQDYPPAYPPAFPAPGPPGPMYTPPPYPPYQGYPSYGPPAGFGYPGFPGAVGAQSTNVLAIVSLISSIAGLLCFIGSVAGIITGVIALSQIKRTSEKGYGLALAGIIVGALGLVLYLVLVAYELR